MAAQSCDSSPSSWRSLDLVPRVLSSEEWLYEQHHPVTQRVGEGIFLQRDATP
jgi:hypothetical protein